MSDKINWEDCAYLFGEFDVETDTDVWDMIDFIYNNGYDFNFHRAKLIARSYKDMTNEEWSMSRIFRKECQRTREDWIEVVELKTEDLIYLLSIKVLPPNFETKNVKFVKKI